MAEAHRLMGGDAWSGDGGNGGDGGGYDDLETLRSIGIERHSTEDEADLGGLGDAGAADEPESSGEGGPTE
jgi:hypothetical protein